MDDLTDAERDEAIAAVRRFFDLVAPFHPILITTTADPNVRIGSAYIRILLDSYDRAMRDLARLRGQ